MKKTFEVSIIETQRKTILIETDDDIAWDEVHSWVSKAYQEGQVALTSVQYKDDDTYIDVTEKQDLGRCTIKLSRNGDTLESSLLSKTNDNTPNDLIDKIQKLRSDIINFIASSYPQKKFEDDNMPFAYRYPSDYIMIDELTIIDGEPSVIYANGDPESLEELSIDELYNILRSLCS